MHVRGALIYNNMLKKMNLEDKLLTIKDKDKVRFSYLKEPNPAMSHVISAPDELPRILGLHEYIDYELQYEKTFRSPIKSITDVIKWKTEKTSSLPFKKSV
jgi:hypothetical protein